MDTESFINRYPKLYHMAEDGSWPNIEKLGLLSTTAIIDKWGVIGQGRTKLENELRPCIVTLKHPVLGIAKLRDQKAMKPDLLSQSLPSSITVGDWCKYINCRVFFWASWSNLKMLLSANAYIGKPHIVITVDTSTLIKSYKEKVFLSDMNTGSTFPGKGMSTPKQRDYNTFKRIDDFNSRWVTEVAVDYSIPNITDYTLNVKRYVSTNKGYENEPQELEILWER